MSDNMSYYNYDTGVYKAIMTLLSAMGGDSREIRHFGLLASSWSRSTERECARPYWKAIMALGRDNTNAVEDQRAMGGILE
jgi:hypothetical protein